MFLEFPLGINTILTKHSSLPRRNRNKSLKNSSKQDSLISASEIRESNFFHCLRPKRRRVLCPPISHPIPREDDSVAFQSSLGDEFANEPSRVEQDLRDGLLTITNVAPELTRRFVLIVRATRQERLSPGSPTALAWHTVCPSSTATRERDRLDFHSFIFTAISLIATPLLLLRSPTSFLPRRREDFPSL